MHIDIITCLPKLIESPFNDSILKRAQQKGLVTVDIIDLRSYATDKHKSVDDYAYGGGAGMVLMIEPVDRCISDLKSKRHYDDIIYMSPDGELLTQKVSNELSLKENLILLCGHYKGVDERVREHLITREISIGDYVLSGGELAAAVVADSVIRLLPGVLNDETSALSDSFQDGLVAPPVYSRPATYKGWNVPDVLLSGHEAKINSWKQEQAIERTRKRRPGLLE
ncbi:tRNA (guanosine(37)-N1)-methyltransferase TrmD [Chryseotalea sanaruensis]|uniref:tRNA (guanine-N(1)-)-methyltransferase n=1 Tax=Chryseotalea sanaruensis TaxID=2482724 RepID=A0A401UCE4_9BACT|nr:tRNA (guanosine(37)-N1)-methyltransferase TrmD [Chryseotalea sanaruensis]GCC52554.1 tRNA (guanosine(37)-N1)-methyltransferase TrmD [Chryseotalea sanaruensis]